MQDVEDAKANEAIRRKSGKDMNKVREDMKAKEAIKAAEQARKGEQCFACSVYICMHWVGSIGFIDLD